MPIEYDFDVIEQLRSSLPESQRQLLELRERLRSRYVKTGWDDELRTKFDMLLRSVLSRRMMAGVPVPETRLEARCLVVAGEAGTGKTESLDRLFRTHPALQTRGEHRSPLVRVTVPAPCTLKTLGRELLRALGYPLSRELADHIIWARIHELLPAAGVLLIHFDEMHNLTDSANSLQLDNIRKALKALMVSPEWPVGLIVSGLPGLVDEMRKVDEIRRRAQFVSVSVLEMPKDVAMVEDLIGALTNVANLTVGQDPLHEIALRLIHGSLGRLGITIELIHEAIEHAVTASQPLGIKHFAAAFTDRTGVAAPLNPFVAPDWAELDCTLVLADEPPIETDWQPTPKSRRGRPRKGARS